MKQYQNAHKLFRKFIRFGVVGLPSIWHLLYSISLSDLTRHSHEIKTNFGKPSLKKNYFFLLSFWAEDPCLDLQPGFHFIQVRSGFLDQFLNLTRFLLTAPLERANSPPFSCSKILFRGECFQQGHLCVKTNMELKKDHAASFLLYAGSLICLIYVTLRLITAQSNPTKHTVLPPDCLQHSLILQFSFCCHCRSSYLYLCATTDLAEAHFSVLTQPNAKRHHL